jgi:alkanesulfonate monooxygenase SsuD/methylene tetrahydromethanopterin reductase-like flavin-dependent oxidoreductase (luciferase family)
MGLKFFLKLDNRFSDGTFLKDVVVEADKLGFYGFLMSDHYMWQTRQPEDMTTLESWVALTYLAAKTEQIRLGTQFTPIPRNSPGILAKMLSTLDVLSSGRVILGVGAGWSQAEFEGYSEWNEPRVRVDKTKEGLELILKLWTEDEVTFKGKYYHVERAFLEPKPVQRPHPTLFISGRPRSHRMLRLAGKYADIFNVAAQTAKGEAVNEEEIQESRDIVLDAAKKENRIDKIAYAKDLRRRQYDSKSYSDDAESAIKLGAKFLITYFPRDGKYLEYMKNFAKEILSSFK